ncbi:hypothetical protein GCM10010404_81820 [Nonomuraea africana]
MVPAVTETPIARRTVDTAAATRLYLEEKLSVREVGRRLGWSHTAIYDALVAAGVELRPRGSRAQIIPADTRRAVVDGYVAGEKMRVLCARYGIAEQSVRNIVAEAGVPLRLGGTSLSGKSSFDREQAALLAEQGWTAPAIAILTGFCEATVRRHLGQIRGRGRKPLPAGDDLAELLDEVGSVRALAARLGCSQKRAREALNDEGIKPLPRTEVLVRMLARTRSGKEVAAELGCSFRRVRRALERAGVPMRRKAA